jgi:nucleoid-associated protein
MSLTIDQVVVHQLVKPNEEKLELVLRDKLLEITPAVSHLLETIHGVYSNKNKAYGLFNPQSLLAESLTSLRAEQQDFLNFSRTATQQLRDELAKYPFATGGIVLFAQYRYLAVQYLIIAVLDSQSSMRVNEQLDISRTHYLDIQHADIIARIDLTEWETQPDSTRYLSFLRGRIGRKVADFFMDFLDASAGLDAKVQNRNLIQAVDDYCEEASSNEQIRQEYRHQVFSWCQQQQQAGEEIAIETLSQAVPAIEDKSFAEFTREQGYQLEASFPADRSTLRALTKYSGSGGGMTLSFDAELLDNRIIWNPHNDTLTIKGLPPNLRDQLQRRKGEK